MLEMTMVGNVGADPVQRASQNGNQFITFSLGVNVSTKKEEKKAQWVEVSCNGEKEGLYNLISKHVKKGDKLLCRGFPTVHGYTDKNDEIRGAFRLYIDKIEILSSKLAAENAEPQSVETADIKLPIEHEVDVI